MEDAVGCAVVLVPVLLLLVGFASGRLRERGHLRSLDAHEAAFGGMLTGTRERFDGAVPGGPPPALVAGEVCIATDYWKSWISSFRKIFGGEMRSYQVLVERARREALLRLLEEARRRGYNAVCNVRLDTADVGGHTLNAKQGAVTVEMLATGTAYRRAEPPAP